MHDAYEGAMGQLSRERACRVTVRLLPAVGWQFLGWFFLVFGALGTLTVPLLTWAIASRVFSDTTALILAVLAVFALPIPWGMYFRRQEDEAFREKRQREHDEQMRLRAEERRLRRLAKEQEKRV